MQTTLIHTIAVSATGNISPDNQEIVELATGGSSDITRTLPPAATVPNQILTEKKVDSGAGAVILAGTGTDTIDGDATYKLVNQYQYVRLVSDGSSWNVIGGN